MKHVVLYVGHLYKPFLTKKKMTRLAGGVREGPNIAKYGPHFWLWSPLEAPKWVRDPGNGLKSIRGIWGDNLGSIPFIHGVFKASEMALKARHSQNKTRFCRVWF